ncbi:hypothetical protein Zmor_003737 [Zophobas morio]|uniref:Retrotransposon gag domain-containing protein n=1 Tax=Zophobas morio TaxID=2755281 RepID=A0AA38HPY1_9CUCU|nr:hypothetical protein Zmor_003737 [Zophobas morio]
MRRFFLTTKSAASLSTQLVQIRQNNMSIEDFGRKVENLLVELTIAQADGNSEALQILRETNEKLAINAFANGLQNPELRTIIKARNYSKLNEAIRGSKDENASTQSSKVFSLHRGSYHNTVRGSNHNYRDSQRSNYGNFNRHNK